MKAYIPISLGVLASAFAVTLGFGAENVVRDDGITTASGRLSVHGHAYTYIWSPTVGMPGSVVVESLGSSSVTFVATGRKELFVRHQDASMPVPAGYLVYCDSRIGSFTFIVSPELIDLTRKGDDAALEEFLRNRLAATLDSMSKLKGAEPGATDNPDSAQVQAEKSSSN